MFSGQIVLKFDMADPDQRDAAEQALVAGKIILAVQHHLEHIRMKVKHDDSLGERGEGMAYARKSLYDELIAQGVDIDSL